MILGDLLVRVRSDAGTAWRREWRRGLPGRALIVVPVAAALGLAGSAATALNAGAWLTWVGVIAAAGFVLGPARPAPGASALATLPAVVTIALLAASPLRSGLVLAESALLWCYLVLLDRWEAPGGSVMRRAGLLGPQLVLAAALVLSGLVVAGAVGGASVPVALAGMLAAVGAAALAVRAGRFR